MKGTKDGKAKAHFGPSALDQVKCKVGQGKQKNELTVTTSRALRFAEPPTFFCVVELCLKRLVLIFLVCTQTAQLTDPLSGKGVVIHTKEAAKVSAAIAGAQKKVQVWRSGS